VNGQGLILLVPVLQRMVRLDLPPWCSTYRRRTALIERVTATTKKVGDDMAEVSSCGGW